MKKDEVKVFTKTPRFTSDNGTPTCTWDDSAGEVCEFFECTDFSEPAFCRACKVDLREMEEDNAVLVVPCPECPVWHSENPERMTPADEIETKRRAVAWARATLTKAKDRSGVRAFEMAKEQLDDAREALLLELADSVVAFLKRDKVEPPASDAPGVVVAPTTMDAIASRLLRGNRSRTCAGSSDDTKKKTPGNADKGPGMKGGKK